MKRKKSKGIDGLVSEVLTTKEFIKKDKHGKYLPFCSYGFHQGLIKQEEVCIERNCKHYQRLYIK